jgi:hypothetical protein
MHEDTDRKHMYGSREGERDIIIFQAYYSDLKTFPK